MSQRVSTTLPRWLELLGLVCQYQSYAECLKVSQHQSISGKCIESQLLLPNSCESTYSATSQSGVLPLCFHLHGLAQVVPAQYSLISEESLPCLIHHSFLFICKEHWNYFCLLCSNLRCLALFKMWHWIHKLNISLIYKTFWGSRGELWHVRAFIYDHYIWPFTAPFSCISSKYIAK